MSDRRRGGRRRRPGPTASGRAREELVELRRQGVPPVTYPEELPVAQRRDEIADAIRDHQVVVVAGETGSGKTTQLPKICLQLGRGVEGMIGHTQPRRLAARTVADRLASELGVDLGTAVGYAVRFADQVGDATNVKLMTDGILLAELRGDRLLRAYDTVIVDEAHERSLNIDFLLGYLTQLLPERPDLKVIVTSATIETDRFAAHFGGAPVIEVSGRTYPVELRYRPLLPDNPAEPPRDQTTAILDALDELRRERPGDVLVFLSGEREIRDTADALRALALRDTEILPLYARLSLADQQRAFRSHPGRRIVLATNVAETSITVPGIRYVIDPGTARISRYSNRLKVQRLPIEPISQASAAQRAGRCGRVAEGICIRLYAEDDFETRPAFTDPEILRTNLASVILQMASLDLGDVAAFPFLDPPDRRAIADGVRLLDELGALDDPSPKEDGATAGGLRLTGLGRRLARLPIDPRYGRMLLEAERHRCLHEVLVIVAGLSIQDPRERPTDQEAQADQLHARFVDPTSDFLAYLNLWNHLRERRRELSSNQFRRECRREHLNILRVREWQDLHAQLRGVTTELGLRENREPAPPDEVHRALLAGLLSHLGTKDPRRGDYLGARNARFTIWPGSALARRRPAWVMAAELVETSRLWGRTAATVQPAWAEELAGHLVKRQHSEPHWSTRRATGRVHERVTLFGLPIVEDRTVDLARIDPELARELFVHHALVRGDWRARPPIVDANRSLLDELGELEHRYRRADLVVDEDTLEQLYLERLPEEIVSGKRFERWWRETGRDRPELLTFTAEDLLGDDIDALDEEAYPAEWIQGELRLGLSYAFDPGGSDDGVAVHIPVAVLNQVENVGFDWLVPGLRQELVVELIRSLPKEIRRELAPVPDTARTVLAQLHPGPEPLLAALERELGPLAGRPITRADWRPERLAPHLRLGFLVVDDDDHVLAQGDDLDQLKAALADDVRRVVATTTATAGERYTTWSFGPIDRVVEQTHHGLVVKGYPTLADEGDAISRRVAADVDEQYEGLWAGIRRLLLLSAPVSRGSVVKPLDNAARLAISTSPYPSVTALIDDAITATVDDLMGVAGGVVWDATAFDHLAARVRADLRGRVVEVLEQAAAVLDTAREVGERAAQLRTEILAPSVADVSAQVDGLVYADFLSAVGPERLPDLHRYLRAALVRLQKLPESPGRDRERMATVRRLEARYDRLLDQGPALSTDEDAVLDVAWLLQELRVAVFAEAVGTPKPVSPQRVARALDALGG